MAESTHRPTKKSAEWTARAERLAKALRDNLHRRKEQARAQERAKQPNRKEGGRADGLSNVLLSSTKHAPRDETGN